MNELKLKKIESHSIATEVFKQLRMQIISNKLKQGDRLIEMEVAEQMGVSRTPVREAIQRLEQEGLVEILPRKHCLVKSIDSEAIYEIVLLRSLIEPTAAKVATLRITEEQIGRLEMYLQESQWYFEQDMMDDLMRVNGLFHEEIISSSGLTRIQNILENLHDYIRHFRRSYSKRSHLAERTIKEHYEILDAIKKRDDILVEKLFVDHLQGLIDDAKVVLEDNI